MKQCVICLKDIKNKFVCSDSCFNELQKTINEKNSSSGFESKLFMAFLGERIYKNIVCIGTSNDIAKYFATLFREALYNKDYIYSQLNKEVNV